jgi:hypothetical protein
MIHRWHSRKMQELGQPETSSAGAIGRAMIWGDPKIPQPVALKDAKVEATR